MATPITSDQLIQYDGKIKEYIEQQILKSTVSLQNQINTIRTDVNDISNNINNNANDNVDNTIDSDELINPINTNLSINSLNNSFGGIPLKSISPSVITVNEDIQEDYIIYDRIITPNEDKVYRNIVVTGDDRSNRVFFSMWYTFDNRELANKNISVIWINPEGDKGETACCDKQLIGNRLYFAWNIPAHCTVTDGIIQYAIRITEGENYAWHTLPAQIECVRGLLTAGWDDIDDAVLSPGWVSYIENKYMVGIIVCTRAEYDALPTKQDDILYLVKEPDESVTQYLGDKLISNSGSAVSRELDIQFNNITGYLQKKYSDSDNWIDVVKIGSSDARELEIRYDSVSHMLQSKYSDESEWRNIVQINNSGGGSGIQNIAQMTTSQYDALGDSVDPTTLYLLTD